MQDLGLMVFSVRAAVSAHSLAMSSHVVWSTDVRRRSSVSRGARCAAQIQAGNLVGQY